MHYRIAVISAWLACVSLASATAARADAPLRTDSADVPAAGNCKVEAWYEGTNSNRDLVVAPACVPFGIIEWGAAYDRSHEAGAGDANTFTFQAKIPVIAKTDPGLIALAATVYAATETGAPHGATVFQQAGINVPASIYLQDDRLRFHANAGVLWRYANGNVFTWGVASEYEMDRVTWLAETYHLLNGSPRLNFGARYAILDEGFDVYASAGRRFGHDPDGWLFTVGIKLESPTFLK